MHVADGHKINMLVSRNKKIKERDQVVFVRDYRVAGIAFFKLQVVKEFLDMRMVVLH